MKMRYHQIKNKKYIRYTVIIIVLLLLFSFGLPSFVSQPIRAIVLPIVKIKQYFNDWAKANSVIFNTKKSLQEENLRLKEEIKKGEINLLSFEILKSENEELKNILERQNGKEETLLTRIILRPPQSPYDTLIINAGEEDNIKVDMLVTYYGEIALGAIDEVSQTTSKVKLFSTPGVDTNVLVGSVNISVVAKGVGGGNFEIITPREIEIKTGDKVILPGVDNFILGIVETIRSSPADAFKKILFKTPINIQELKWVEVVL